MAMTDVRVDHTQHDVRQSAWTAPDERPRAGDPAAMLAAYEANKPVVVDDALPTAASPTAQCERAYVVYHMRTCLKCRLHSAASLVTCVSYKGSEKEMDEGLERLRRWKSMPSPECYMRYMHHSVRTGFEPSFDTEPAAIRMRNHKPTYDDYPTTVTHLDQIEPMGVLSGGCASMRRRRQTARATWSTPSSLSCATSTVARRRRTARSRKGAWRWTRRRRWSTRA